MISDETKAKWHKKYDYIKNEWKYFISKYDEMLYRTLKAAYKKLKEISEGNYSKPTYRDTHFEGAYFP